jgi:hypothetical protein
MDAMCILGLPRNVLKIIFLISGGEMSMGKKWPKFFLKVFLMSVALSGLLTVALHKPILATFGGMILHYDIDGLANIFFAFFAASMYGFYLVLNYRKPSTIFNYGGLIQICVIVLIVAFFVFGTLVFFISAALDLIYLALISITKWGKK